MKVSLFSLSFWVAAAKATDPMLRAANEEIVTVGEESELNFGVPDPVFNCRTCEAISGVCAIFEFGLSTAFVTGGQLPGEVGLEERCEEIPPVVAVEGGQHGTAGLTQRRQRQSRHERVVDVEQIEALALEDRLQGAPEPPADAHAREAAVVEHRQAAADADHSRIPLGYVAPDPAGDHRHFVVKEAQLPGQRTDVLAHIAHEFLIQDTSLEAGADEPEASSLG